MGIELIGKARAFAHEAHDSILQKRKYSDEPYWVHVDEVAEIVTKAIKEIRPELTERDYETIAACYTHDIYEDVMPVNEAYTRALLIKELSAGVDKLTLELTDVFTHARYPESNRAARKREERLRVSKISPEGHTIKLADIISNTRSIVANDPDFARVYLREILDTLPVLTKGLPSLFEKASRQVIEASKTLDLTIPLVTA